MSYCCVPGCKSDKRKEWCKMKTFHCFPASPTIRREWLVKIRRDAVPHFKILNNTRVCSDHFPEESYQKTPHGMRNLKEGVVPTLFPWTPTEPAGGAITTASHPATCGEDAVGEESDAVSEESDAVSGESDAVGGESDAVGGESDAVGGESESSHSIGQDLQEDVACTSGEAETSSPHPDLDCILRSVPLEEQLREAREIIARQAEEISTLRSNLSLLKRFQDKQILLYKGVRERRTLKAVLTAFQPTADADGAALLHTFNSRMMQARVCLRQDTATTLPELSEQRRTRTEEEDLSGLESVHMAESETECAAPGLNTLEPECVTAHSGVSDVHHTHASLIKTETDLGSPHTGDLKTEDLDRPELGYVTHLHPDQIKSGTDGEGCLEAEQVSDLNIRFVDIKSDQLKSESSESLVSDPNTVMNGASVDHNIQTDPWELGGEPSPNTKKEEIPDLLVQCGDLNPHCDGSNGNNVTGVVHKSANSSSEHLNYQRNQVIIEHGVNSSNNASLFDLFQTDEGDMQTGEKPYKCTQCEKRFRAKSDFNTHMRIHTGEKPYKCTQCEKCFNAKSSLNVHVRIHTGEKPHKCSECGKCFAKKSHLNVHLRVHTGEKPYTCTHCGKGFSAIFHLNTHLKIHTREKPYKCTQCEMCFIAKAYLNSHMRVHTGEKPYKCPQCGKCFSKKSHLNIHLRIHTGEKPYPCTQCGKCFVTTFHLNTHMRIHTGEKPYKCPTCEKCFSARSTLNAHLKTHTGEKPFECTQCGRWFSTMHSLNTHQKIHTGDKAYKCLQCEKGFYTKSSLDIHLRNHTGEKPFKCAQCEKCFNAKSSLHTHMRVHTGEKPFKCTLCGKCFSTTSPLNVHLKQYHTGERPHKCAQCEKCFFTKHSLDLHLRIHTGEKPYTCTQCGKCFAQISNLSRHQRIHSSEHPKKHS